MDDAKKSAPPSSDARFPLSIPFDKGQGPVPNLKITDESRHSQRTDEKPAATKYAGIAFWKILLAMLLFPFIFNGGTDVYIWGKAQLFPSPEVKISAEPRAPQSPQNSAPLDAKTLEGISGLIAGQRKMLDEGVGKVVVIHPSYPGTFSLDAEKNKIYELSGVNLDDPLAGSEKISKIKSPDILFAIMESFDRIVLSAAQYGISEFHVKNSLEGKRQALRRIQELR
ncbi:MAG: hypothetical protein HY280_06295 [Nitrospinae bacterium]|nr:hypothetical protein [Nitrospinota bacterium]